MSEEIELKQGLDLNSTAIRLKGFIFMLYLYVDIKLREAKMGISIEQISLALTIEPSLHHNFDPL